MPISFDVILTKAPGIVFCAYSVYTNPIHRPSCHKAQINGLHHPNEHKLRTYCQFKSIFEREMYLDQNFTTKLRQNFTKLRISSHSLAIETGRYTRPKTPASERFCQMCSANKIENEKHFILYCDAYASMRHDLYNILNVIDSRFHVLDDNNKFIYIMTMGDNNKACQPILRFINFIFELRHNRLGC